jgi:molecular chaperone GrpE (heat shock protein)
MRKVKQLTRVALIDLLPEFIFGAEDSVVPPGTGTPPADPNPNPEGDPQEDDPAEEDLDSKDLTGLKSALSAEREARKAEEKERKRLAKELQTRKEAEEQEELKKKSDLEQAQIKEKAATDKATKLAEGFLREKLDTAIRNAASNFVDPTDAIDKIDRSKLTYEQDSDDPSKVTIDMKSVEKAVKDLATKKPHFLKTGTPDGQPTGGQFGGSGNQNNKQTPEEVYKERYSALR